MIPENHAGEGADGPTLEDARLSGMARLALKSNRMIIALCAIGLLTINVATGLLAYGLQDRIAKSAIGIYDHAFVSTNYIHQAQVGFQHFLADRRNSHSQLDISKANEQLSVVLDDLDVAIERAGSPAAHAKGLATRAQVAALADSDVGEEDRSIRLIDAQDAMERLAQSTSAIGLRSRDEVEDVASNATLWLLGSIVASVVLAGLALFTVRSVIAHRTISYMTYMATYDHLTGLPNRSQFRTYMKDALRRLRNDDGAFAVFSLDLDRFKNVNDTLGHPTGDRLLIEVANRIKGVLRSDDMVARFGGDEFVILQKSTRELLEAGALAERLVATISAPYQIDELQIVIGASVGVVLAPQDGEEVEELLRKADVALYRAKAGGKGQFKYFTTEMNVFMQARREMELELRKATEQRQLEVFYQPLMDISTGRFIACEALVRWIHPTRGAISPMEFIPLAEECGLIDRIGEQVLRTACEEAASWKDELRVSVNLSAIQFHSGSLPSLVNSVLSETGLDPRRLELEITESILIGDKERVMQTLSCLRELGVRIALDDFGTGYSSLAYLTSFPFDKIKIDRSFVRDIIQRPDSAAIVRAILSLAMTLDLSTTAEGVEKFEELDWLRLNGCEQAQGFLFSPAVRARDLKLLLGMKTGSRADENAPREGVTGPRDDQNRRPVQAA